MEIEEIEMDGSPHRRIWTNDEIGAIINEVHQRPFLYDKRHADYKQNSKKDGAWEEIAASLPNKNLTARECKRKWNTLRIQKRRIINQQGKKKGKHQVQWLFFDTLNFLMPHMEWPSSRDGTAKKDSSDVEYDENTCGETYENFQPTFTIKKQEDEEDEHMHEEATNEECSETDEGHMHEIDPHANSSNLSVGQTELIQEHQQQQTNHEDPLIIPYHEIHQHENSASPSSTAAEIIRLIHPSQTQTVTSKGQQVFMTAPASATQQQIHHHHQQQQHHQQQHHHQQQQKPQQHQQMIINTHPVTLARYQQIETHSHQSNVDSTGVVNNSALGSTIASNVESPMTPTGHSTVVSAMPSSSNNRLNYFLMDVQQQMEKLSEIEQMELKVDMQKLLLDKLRNSDYNKISRCE